MAEVCKWLSVYLCLRESPKTDKIHPGAVADDGRSFDAVIVWKESPKKKSGGLAYEVILKEASTTPRPNTPKERPISQEIIERKLKEAEERRLSVEAGKLEAARKEQEKLEEANRRQQEMNENHAKLSKEKNEQRIRSMEEKKLTQLGALRDRLKEHAKRIEDAQRTNNRCVQEVQEKVRQHLAKDIQTKEQNRAALLAQVQDKLRDHHAYVDEVIESSKQFSKVTEEKTLQKMENSLKNREDQLSELMQRLQCRDEHARKVRQNKLNQSLSDEAAGN
ncbi:hypothetical protein CAPTEDRAFT_226874 [Capitella teleta]|uniref:Stathmin n=1 Tax=Capitella teleta TaxID=283909 RepID=R7UYE2_CAPTE|nr:hypothetical protein CAPTEDRAFT_226874 [Capitella teleta]|eukprot:ELU11334.1 hypothetical protein CAPTEDRAFT_226874 [Capitella teleta]